VNVKLLRKVKKHILATPLRLHMANWLLRKGLACRVSETGEEIKFPSCKTAGCINGWGFILSGIKREPSVGGGMRLFGLTKAQAEKLFLPSRWPNQFWKGRRDDGRKETATVAAARIEHFIKTKGRE
jgi:hypothetical protein